MLGDDLVESDLLGDFSSIRRRVIPGVLIQPHLFKEFPAERRMGAGALTLRF